MHTHRVIAERLEALLGPPRRSGELYTWRVPLGRHTVNIRLDLPDPSTRVRVWIFDPRASGDACARHFTIENTDELEDVVGEVAALAREKPEGEAPTSGP